MIIRTHVDISTLKAVSKETIAKEKPVVNEVSKKKNNNKKVVTPAPVVEEPIVEVVEEDKIDLSEWLKDDEIEN